MFTGQLFLHTNAQTGSFFCDILEKNKIGGEIMQGNGKIYIDLIGSDHAWIRWVAAGLRLEGYQIGAGGIPVDSDPPLVPAGLPWDIEDVFIECSRIKDLVSSELN